MSAFISQFNLFDINIGAHRVGDGIRAVREVHLLSL